MIPRLVTTVAFVLTYPVIIAGAIVVTTWSLMQALREVWKW